mmetsp:Transcript_4632/g.8537  ORF Transcript_4632/g.8537 Transcript_4632/m.8537 type:complete len:85 (+) Transcript_4632:146-400(+)
MLVILNIPSMDVQEYRRSESLDRTNVSAYSHGFFLGALGKSPNIHRKPNHAIPHDTMHLQLVLGMFCVFLFLFLFSYVMSIYLH